MIVYIHFLLPLSLSLFLLQGICYVWSLSSGVGTSPITLTPRVKKHAHTRHALKCLFSPDSRYNCPCFDFNLGVESINFLLHNNKMMVFVCSAY